MVTNPHSFRLNLTSEETCVSHNETDNSEGNAKKRRDFVRHSIRKQNQFTEIRHNGAAHRWTLYKSKIFQDTQKWINQLPSRVVQ